MVLYSVDKFSRFHSLLVGLIIETLGRSTALKRGSLCLDLLVIFLIYYFLTPFFGRTEESELSAEFEPILI